MSALLEAARAVSAVWAGPTPVEQYLERMTLAINVLRAAIEAESAYVPMTDEELMRIAHDNVDGGLWRITRAIEQAVVRRMRGEG